MYGMSVMVTQPLVAQNSDGTPQVTTNVTSTGIGIGVGIGNLMSAPKEDTKNFFNYCLYLAKRIDHGVANNKPPAKASELTLHLKQVCCQKDDLYVQSAIMVAIMVLMLSVKNACTLGWFSSKETEELLALADEVGKYFCTRGDINSETSVLGPTLSSAMSRYYPAYKLGQVITSFEVKPGYATYVVDFHLTKDLLISKDERIRLLMVTKDSVETSSCIISPQQVSIFLNGRPVDKRTNVIMDPRPQAPTLINHLLKVGMNVLQAVGQFNGHCILVIAAMSTLQTSALPALQDYVQSDIILSEPDSEVIEGASRISLNCPISCRRINIPVKGHLCKHYQCFDKSNYVEINIKRPSWKCPHCNQSVGFTDLRVDRTMVKVLQEVGEDISEVIFHADGSWKGASSSGNNSSHDKTTNKQGEHEADESYGKSDGQYVFDLTGEDCERDSNDGHEFVEPKPVVNHNIQSQSVYPNSTSTSNPRSANELFEYSFSQHPNSQSSGELLCVPSPTNYNIEIAPVLTDAASPSINRLPSNFQGTHYPLSSLGISQLSPTESSQLQEVFYGRSTPRNVSQGSPFQMPTPSSQQHHLRPIMSLPAQSRSYAPIQVSPGAVERQWYLQQSHINACPMSSMPIANHGASQYFVEQGVGMSAPSYNISVYQPLSQPPDLMRPPQTISQPPHIMRSSQHPYSYPQQVVPAAFGSNNSPSTFQRTHLTASQASLAWEQPTVPSHPHLSRTLSSSYSNTGFMPQASSRTENIIDLQQAEQTWRPTGQMRGAFTGEAYAAALNHMNPGSTSSPTPCPRPSATSTSSLTNNQILLANRMIAHATQMPN